jgi:hypothetical protein
MSRLERKSSGWMIRATTAGTMKLREGPDGTKHLIFDKGIKSVRTFLMRHRTSLLIPLQQGTEEGQLISARPRLDFVTTFDPVQYFVLLQILPHSTVCMFAVLCARIARGLVCCSERQNSISDALAYQQDSATFICRVTIRYIRSLSLQSPRVLLIPEEDV